MACAALFVWIVVIFVLSTDYFSSARTAPFVAQFVSKIFPALSAVNPATIELLTRKLAHWIEYFILAVLFMQVFSSTSAERTPKGQTTWGLTLGMICAVMDEFHQSFVSSRTASSRDVLINAIGFVCGTLSFYTYLAIKRVKQNPQHS
jgi:VanZ family protein